MDVWLDERIRSLAEELKYVKSVDSYLIKLSSLVYDLEDYSYGDEKATREMLEKALRNPLLVERLKPLSCYVDVVEASILGDPRMKKLRGYVDVIVKVLSEIPCKEEKPLVVSREATFRVEKAEKETEERRGYVVKATERKSTLVRVLTLIGVVLVAVAILAIVLSILH